MKRLLPMVLGFFLCHCGTEVGNGVAPEPKAGESQGDGAPTSAPEVDTDYGSPTSLVLSSSFLVACASPFAEPMEGTFVEAAGRTFGVTQAADGSKTVSRSDGSLYLVIKPAAAGGIYAIETLPAAPQLSCGPVSSTTLADGGVQRSVTFNDGTKVQWTLGEGRVTGMKLTSAAGAVESWNRR